MITPAGEDTFLELVLTVRVLSPRHFFLVLFQTPPVKKSCEGDEYKVREALQSPRPDFRRQQRHSKEYAVKDARSASFMKYWRCILEYLACCERPTKKAATPWCRATGKTVCWRSDTEPGKDAVHRARQGLKKGRLRTQSGEEY